MAPPVSGAPAPAAPTSGISMPANTGSSPGAGGGKWPYSAYSSALDGQMFVSVYYPSVTF